MTQQIIRCRVRMWPFGECDWHTLADVYGGYAVHQRYGYEDSYTVTEVSSGLAVCHRPTRKEALAEREGRE